SAIEVRRRIAYRDEDGVGRFVVRGRRPHAAAAALPCIGILGAVSLLLRDVTMEVGVFRLGRPGTPPSVSRHGVVARGGDRVPAPHLLARGDVVRREVTPNTVLASGHADNDVVTYHE